MFEKEWLVGNPELTAEEIPPIEERVKDNPKLIDGLTKLKSIIGEEKFNRYVSPLQNIARNDTSLLIRTRNVLERSFFIRECGDALRDAFAVKAVTVIG